MPSRPAAAVVRGPRATLRRVLATSLAALALTALPAGVLAQQTPSPWEIVRRGEGIVVDRRRVPGSNLFEFRGRGIVAAPLAKVVAVIQDAARRTEWMDRCVESRALAYPTERSQISYTRTKGMLGVSDRDSVTDGRAIFDVDRKEVRLVFTEVTHPAAPPRKGIVRMPRLRGHWILRPARGNPAHTEAEYLVHADPGGWLPRFVVNLVSKQIPYKTIVRLRRQVARASYAELEAKIRALPEYRQILP